MTPNPTHNDGVLAPEDLHLEDDHVSRIDDNRFVVRSEADADEPEASPDADPDASSLTQLEPGHARGLADAAEPHGVDIALKTDGEIARHRATSNDVREVFADLLTWYADQLDDDLSPEDALRVMLAASDLEV